MEKKIGGCALQNPNVWEDVKSDIELKILSGVYMPGERIPSVRKLAEYYGVGQTTAQKVLTALWQEEIIESKRGVGFFVRPYTKEPLTTKRKESLEKRVKGIVEEAALLNVDLPSMVDEYTKVKEGKRQE